MFVHLGDAETSRPTYFEVVAADRLVPSLNSAFIYALSVLSQRHPWVHRILDYDDETVALLTLALDGHSLWASDSTFADSLYGLKRRPLHHTRKGTPRLTRKQRWGILAFQVLLPYIRAKLNKAYRRSAGPGIAGLALRYAAIQAGADSNAGGASPEGSAGHVGWRQRLECAFVAAYPWLHAGVEGVSFAYQLSYLLGAGEVHHPTLHALGVAMGRISSEDLTAAARDKQARRQALLGSLLPGAAAAAAGGAAAAAGLGAAAGAPGGGAPGSRLSAAAARGYGWLVRALLGARWLAEDHAGSALTLAVFGFKALEWWYTGAEEQVTKGKALPPPPPPPPLRPSPLGVGLPADPSDCPLCRSRTTNPATLVPSGYVFCYPCAFRHVLQHGACPVTCVPAALDHIRRLYEAG